MFSSVVLSHRIESLDEDAFIRYMGPITMSLESDSAIRNTVYGRQVFEGNESGCCVWLIAVKALFVSLVQEMVLILTRTRGFKHPLIPITRV